ncbi:GMP synthase (glutamine-hydrolyzing) [Halarchaeum solikamskense]|uniref:type 1 glutamine amidotransferase n=1 Tax=Halarchaeum nitratireducens TaxID=489913 RepID=UPI001B3AE400|nr:type 1 glutamine amidotransferase [Halarchaeum solikamskense]MBP2252399.1 GMP synthase (glutamine-hydrolyzing) [Halarchaeum solikamskense]
MISVLDTEVEPDYRYLGPEIARLLSASDYRVFADDPTPPDLDDVDGIVLSGSTASVYDDHDWIDPESRLVKRCVERNVPLLGICFGHQLVNQALGGTVERDERRATFVKMSRTDPEDAVLDGVAPIVPVLHADVVTELGDGMVATASTSYSDYFCSRHVDAPLWTVQFHPEFTERVVGEPDDFTPGAYGFADSNATRVLDNFARVCER